MHRLRTFAAAIAIAGTAPLAGCGATTTGTAPDSGAGSALDQHLPAAVLRTRFTDETGKTVRLSDYGGRTIVLQDVLTLCQEHCPIDTATFVQTARRYAATAPDPSNAVFLSITIDPARDSPAQLAAYRKLYVGSESDLPRWHLLTASPAALARLWQRLHVYVQKVPEAPGEVVRNWRTGQRLTYDVDHQDIVYMIDGHGVERYLFDGQPYLHGGAIPPKMEHFMSNQGHHNEMRGAWTSKQALRVIDRLTGAAA